MDTVAIRSTDLTGVRVLVVEASWHVAKALQSALERLGIVVTGLAATVAHADRLVAEQSPDVAVVETNLRGEMTNCLIDRMHDRGLRVVLVSGYDILPNLSEKTAAILHKPYTDAELVTALRQVMQQDGTLNA